MHWAPGPSRFRPRQGISRALGAARPRRPMRTLISSRVSAPPMPSSSAWILRRGQGQQGHIVKAWRSLTIPRLKGPCS